MQYVKIMAVGLAALLLGTSALTVWVMYNPFTVLGISALDYQSMIIGTVGTAAAVLTTGIVYVAAIEPSRVAAENEKARAIERRAVGAAILYPQIDRYYLNMAKMKDDYDVDRTVAVLPIPDVFTDVEVLRTQTSDIVSEISNFVWECWIFNEGCALDHWSENETPDKALRNLEELKDSLGDKLRDLADDRVSAVEQLK